VHPTPLGARPAVPPVFTGNPALLKKLRANHEFSCPRNSALVLELLVHTIPKLMALSSQPSLAAASQNGFTDAEPPLKGRNRDLDGTATIRRFSQHA
jgi:hypothetical protein